VGAYESRLRSLFDAKCRELDLDLLLVYGGSLEGPNKWWRTQNSVYELVRSNCADGVVVVSTSLASYSGPDAARRLIQRCLPMPVCSLGLEVPGVPSVTIDNRSGMHAVVEHLLRDHGCRNVAFLTGTPKNPEGETRFQVYRELLDRYEIPWDPERVACGHFVRTSGSIAMEEILARGVAIDAVVAANDNMALGAMEVLRKHGYRMPHDVLVTGFDDLPVAGLASPPLTTLAQPFDDMVEVAVQLVLDQIAGRAVSEHTTLSPKFVVRKSCGCDLRKASHRPADEPTVSLGAAEVLCHHAESLNELLTGCLRSREIDGSLAAAHLLAGLERELNGQRGSFLGAVETMLQAAEVDDDRLRSFDDAVGILRKSFRDLARSDVEDLWHEARELIRRAHMCAQLVQRAALDSAYNRTQTVSMQLAPIIDQPSLNQVLLKALPGAGFPTIFLSRYPENSTSELEPVICLRDGVCLEPNVSRFAAHELVPPGCHLEDRRFSLAVFPLAFEAKCLGLMVVEYRPDTTGYQLLGEQLASALRSLELFQEVREKTMLHERSVQERLATTKRMQSLSVLAGGVAHDLNNVLGPLVALPDVILSDLAQLGVSAEATGDLVADVESIKSAALRASQTIKDLLTLGRQGKAAKALMDLNQSVAAALASDSFGFVRDTHGRVKVVVDIASDPLVINASEIHLVRALGNLILNAVQAIAGEGEVVVSTCRIRLTEPVAGYENIDPGDYAVVRVSDNGGGIPASDLHRIFEPFFSKKRLADHSGSGLGLAIVHGVVKEHEGFLDVTSNVGHGTTFTLYFPRTAEPAHSREEVVHAPHGNASILLIDDEPIQLRTGRRVLGHLGYKVDVLESGQNAHDLFARAAASGQSPYDLVILDMNLAEDLDGLDVFEQIQQLFPEQRAILVSGHAPNERAEFAIGKGLAWLAKPYTTEGLARAVQAALSGRSRRTVVTLSSKPAPFAP
jgi:DNA-binding LacI/PurR family transcriptional regulator/signal transduction histidine kinase/CheY-like chemotaxis protein